MNPSRLKILAAAIFLLGTAACGSGGGASTPDGETVRLGYQKTTWGSPLILANEIDAWKDSEVDIKPITLSSGGDVRDGILAGSLDAGSLGSAPFVVGASKGGVVAVAVIAYAGRTEAVVVPADSPVKDISDLKGKKIGSQSGSLTHEVFVSKVAPDFGLSEGDYQIVELTFQDMYSAMVAGQVDAFAGVDPYPQLALHNDTGRILTTYEDYDVVPLYLCVSKDMADNNPDAVVGLLEGWLRTIEKWQDDPEGTRETVSNVFAKGGTELPDPVMEASLGNMDVTADFAPDTEQYLTEQAQSLIDQGQIDDMPDWSEVIDTSFLEEAQGNIEEGS